jgi:hypothetical protein
MKKIILVLSLLLSIVSCTNDVSFNDPSFQGVKSGETWRANDARVILNADGTMTVEAYSQFEIVTLNVASSGLGLKTFGVNGSNTATYKVTLNGVTDTYTTGIGSGSGQINITQNPTATGKLKATFNFRAVNAAGVEEGFTGGVVFNVPVK